jgi:hypothetical protein
MTGSNAMSAPTTSTTGATTPPSWRSQPGAEVYRQAIRGNQRFLGMSIAIRLVVAAVVIAAVVIPLISVGNTVSSINIPSPGPLVTGIGGTKTAGGGAKPARTPSKPASYLTAAGARAGLAQVAKLIPRARLALVRLDANSLTASARLPNGTFKEVAFEPTGSFVTSGADSGQRLLPISQIRPRAVARIVSAMRARFHVPAAQIDYMVLSSPPGAPTQWIIFTKAPKHPGFTATLAGARLARLPS